MLPSLYITFYLEYILKIITDMKQYLFFFNKKKRKYCVKVWYDKWFTNPGWKSLDLLETPKFVTFLDSLVNIKPNLPSNLLFIFLKRSSFLISFKLWVNFFSLLWPILWRRTVCSKMIVSSTRWFDFFSLEKPLTEY